MDAEPVKTYNINTKFILLKLYDVEVIIMISNGYVNITKLCRYENKQFKDWKDLEASKKLLESIESIKENTKLIINVGYKNREMIKGEYISPELLQYATYWISPYIAIQVSIIMRHYYRKLLTNIETQEDIVYGELIHTYIYQIKEKYDKRVEEVNKYFDEIENDIYNKLTACLLEKAEHILSRNYNDTTNTNYEDSHEINKKIEYIEQELENNNKYRNSILDIIKDNKERSGIYISSLLTYCNTSYKDTLIRIKAHLDSV
ncbi:p28-like protein [Fowlpox virus]|nr:p28-like protein [Fowlpox virus]